MKTYKNFINEAQYMGNIGMMEMFKFMEIASSQQKKTLEQLIASKKTQQAWHYIQAVTGMKLNTVQ